MDGFVVKRFQITNRQFLAFLNNLVNNGQQDAALAYVPRERTGMADETGAMVYGQNPDGSLAGARCRWRHVASGLASDLDQLGCSHCLCKLVLRPTCRAMEITI